MSPRSATSSRALAAFSVARTRSGLAGEDALGTRFEGAALQPDETADAALGDGEERVQPRAAEGHRLGRARHLHELAAAGHDDVHVHLGTRVLGVAEVEQRLTLDDTDADRGDVVADRRRGLLPRDLRDRVGHRDEAAGDGGGARAAVRLDHVAVHPERAPGELRAVDDGAEGPADDPLDLLRPAARTAVLAGRARVGRARQHRVLRRDPALALALHEGRHLVLERRRADHLGRAELDQHRALGVEQEVPGDGDGAELVGRAAVGAGHGAYRAFVSAGSPAARTRWSPLRLYSARPATLGRAVSSPGRASFSRRSSFGVVAKTASSTMAGIRAAP